MAGFFSTVCQAHVLTDGLAAAEACRMPLLGFLAKSVREAAFPTPLVQKAVWSWGMHRSSAELDQLWICISHPTLHFQTFYLFLIGSDAKNVCCNLHGQKLQACDLPVTSWQVELYVKVPTLGLGRWHRASRCQPSVRQDSHPEFYQVATRKDQGQAPAAENGLSKDLTKTDLENNRTENKTLFSKMFGFTNNYQL